jgi:hypothetical protein
MVLLRPVLVKQMPCATDQEVPRPRLENLAPLWLLLQPQIKAHHKVHQLPQPPLQR